MKNLLVITSAFPNNLNEYEGIFVKNLLLNIKHYFNKIYVIRPQYYINPKLDFLNLLPSTWKEKPIRQDYVIDNIHVFFPKVSILGFIKKLQIKKFIEKEKIKFDIIHSHFIYPSGEIGNYLKKIYNKHHIITGHGFDVYNLPFRNIFWKYKIKNILKQADVITTVSKSNANKLSILGFDNIKIIPNGFDENIFYYMENKDNLKKKLNIPLNKKIILNVGNLIPLKNQKNLILACKELLKIRNDFICYIIGDGILKNELQNLIDENNLNNFIKLLGRKKQSEVAKYMNVSDLFILPSLKEGNPTVVVEALATGSPIIGSKTAGGLSEIINSEIYGIIIDNPLDINEIKEKIDMGLNKQWDRKIILEYAKFFSYKNIGSLYIDIYNDLLNKFE